VAPTHSTPNRAYQFFFDAGSSGTRAHGFQVDLHQGLIPMINEFFHDETTPGISGQEHPTHAADSITSLLQKGLGLIPQEAQGFDLWFFATAGMRLLEATNTTKSTAVMTAIQETLPNLKQIDIISGATEALFGWVAANYADQRIQAALDPQTTCPVIDLGGVSTQFSRMLDASDADIPRDVVTTRKIGEADISILSVSYPTSGHDKAREIKNDFLVEHDYQDDPCTNLGDTLVATHTQTGKTLSVPGSGDWHRCKALMTTLNMPSIEVNYKPLKSLEPVIAISAFYHTRVSLALNETSQVEDWENAGKAFCAEHFSRISHQPLAQSACFRATYCHALMEAYQFPPTQQIRAVSKLNGFDVNWPLGAAVWQSLKSD